jgi:ABC-2 type transport system ATP-binding protein
MTPAIRIRNLTKRYGALEALCGIDLEVSEGTFFGLLGPNGAGKTTTINILSGLGNKTDGEVELFGYDLVRQYRHCRRLVGLVPQEFNFDQFARVHKVLEFQGGYFGIDRATCRRRAEELMARFDLLAKRETPARLLSGGMKRRLMIARALVHRPRLLILDEPTAGVDVDLRRSLWHFLREINEQGTTILLTTHYIEEAESLCKCIGIINHGRIIELDSTRNLANRLSRESILVTCQDPVQAAATGRLAAYEPRVTGDGYELVLTFDRDQVSYDRVLREVTQAGLTILNLRPADNRLEQVFLHLTHNGTHHV